MISNGFQSVHIKLEITIMIMESILFAWSFKLFVMAFLVKFLFLLVIGTFFTRADIDNIAFAVMVFWKLTATIRTVNTCFIRCSSLNGECISTDFVPVLSTTVVVIDVFIGSSTKWQTPSKKIRTIFNGFDFCFLINLLISLAIKGWRTSI